MLIVFAAGVLNGSFTLPMMYSRTWNWENIGSVYSLAALFVFRRALATVFVPKLSQVYRDLKWDAVLYPVLSGFLSGFAQTTFGLSTSAVGMAIAFAIVCGLVCVTGSLVSILAFDPADLFQPLGLKMLLSLPVLLLGLVFYGCTARGISFKTGLASLNLHGHIRILLESRICVQR